MSTNFPTSLDNSTTMPVVIDNTTTVSASHHNNQSDALIAVEGKVGIGASTPTSGKLLISNGTGTSEWRTLTSGDIPSLVSVYQTVLTNSAGLLAALSDETGTGLAVFNNTPTLITPVLGVASATSINKVAITAPATSATLTIANGKTLTASNTLTLTATDGSTLAIGAGGTLGTGAYATIANYAPLASPTFTGTVTLPKTLEIQDTSADHQYVLAVSELTADRTVTLPLLASNDEFVFKNAVQTETNKTLSTSVKLDANADPNFTLHGIYRQALVNSNFDFWESGTSFTSLGWCADRWYIATGTAGRTITRQLAGLDGSTYCMRIARDSGISNTTSQVYAYGGLESIDGIKFRNKKVTLSFWARGGANWSPTSGILSVGVKSGTGTDESFTTGSYTTGNNVDITGSAVLTTNGTWTKYTYTSASALGATVTQLSLGFSVDSVGTAGANDYCEITQLQICAGDVALPYSPMPRAHELKLCQYFKCVFSNPTSTLTPYGVGVATSTGDARIFVKLPVTMRTEPSLVVTAADLELSDSVSAATDCTSVSYATNMAGKDSCALAIQTGGTSLTAYRQYMLRANAATSKSITFLAEL